MRKRVARVLALTILLFCFGRLVLGQSRSRAAGELAGLESAVRTIVDEERLNAGVPAMSVAVVADGRTVVLYASGMADVEAHVPATTETLFRAASVTKLLTATLVMREVERGRLSLDAPVNDRLPAERRVRDSVGAPVAVTLRHLLSHSSGLGASTPVQRGPRSLDEYLSEGLVTIETPGKRLIYANDAFALAGWLAGQAEGKSYDVLAQEVLLDPLGMAHSTFKNPSEAGPNLAAAYGDIGLTISTNRGAHPRWTSALAPAGALITTASDLGRFGLAILGHGELDGVRVLSRASVEEMIRLGVRAHPRMPEGFGLGFGVRDSPGRKLVYWSGLIAGAAARVTLLPEHGVGIAILANLPDDEAVEQVSTRVLALLVTPPPQNVVPIDRGALAEMVGRFRLRDVLDRRFWYVSWLAEASVEMSDDDLLVSVPIRRHPARLVQVAPNLFQAKGKSDGAYLTFEGNELFFSVLRGGHLPVWQTSRAIIVLGSAATLLLASLAAWGVIRLVRRSQRRAFVH